MDSTKPQFLKKLNKYILSNLKESELYKYNKFLRCLGYNSSFEYIFQLVSDNQKFNLDITIDNYVKSDLMLRYNNLKKSWFFKPSNSRKLIFVKNNHDILDIVNVMIYNFFKASYQEENIEKYRKYLNSMIRNRDYFDFRYKRKESNKGILELNYNKLINNELIRINLEYELNKKEVQLDMEGKSANVEYKKPINYPETRRKFKKIGVTHQFIFLSNESDLHYLGFELERLGYISNKELFVTFFSLNISPSILKSEKLNWNSDLFSLGYLIYTMIYLKIIDKRSLKNINPRVSSLFTYLGGKYISPKRFSSRVSSRRKKNPDIFKESPVLKDVNLLNIYLLVSKLSKR